MTSFAYKLKFSSSYKKKLANTINNGKLPQINKISDFEKKVRLIPPKYEKIKLPSDLAPKNKLTWRVASVYLLTSEFSESLANYTNIDSPTTFRKTKHVTFKN